MLSRRAFLAGTAAVAATAVLPPIDPVYAGEVYAGHVSTYNGVVFGDKLTIADIQRCVAIMKKAPFPTTYDDCYVISTHPRQMIPRA